MPSFEVLVSSSFEVLVSPLRNDIARCFYGIAFAKQNGCKMSCFGRFELHFVSEIGRPESRN
jgi:hypothetical protein